MDSVGGSTNIRGAFFPRSAGTPADSPTSTCEEKPDIHKIIEQLTTVATPEPNADWKPIPQAWDALIQMESVLKSMTSREIDDIESTFLEKLNKTSDQKSDVHIKSALSEEIKNIRKDQPNMEIESIFFEELKKMVDQKPGGDITKISGEFKKIVEQNPDVDIKSIFPEELKKVNEQQLFEEFFQSFRDPPHPPPLSKYFMSDKVKRLLELKDPPDEENLAGSRGSSHLNILMVHLTWTTYKYGELGRTLLWKGACNILTSANTGKSDQELSKLTDALQHMTFFCTYPPKLGQEKLNSFTQAILIADTEAEKKEFFTDLQPNNPAI